MNPNCVLNIPGLMVIRYRKGQVIAHAGTVAYHMGRRISFFRACEQYVGTICGLGDGFAILKDVFKIDGTES